MKTFKLTTAFIETWCFWMVVTSVCWLIGYLLAGYLIHRPSLRISNEFTILIGVMCGGGLVALGQWQYLGPKVKVIGTWAISSGLGLLIFARGGISSLPNTFQEIVGAWTIGSVMVSLVTVIALVTLFPKSMSKDPRTPIKWSFLHY
jgi:hypothetical protein